MAAPPKALSFFRRHAGEDRPGRLSPPLWAGTQAETEGLDAGPGALLGFRRSQGFHVRHLKWGDPAHARTAEERLSRGEEIAEAHTASLCRFGRGFTICAAIA